MRRSWRGRSLALLAAVLATALPATSVAVLTPATPAGALPTLPAPDSHGITLTGWSEVAFDARLGDAVV